MLYLGVDLGGTNIKAALVNSEGEILCEANTPTNLPRPAEAVCDDIAALCLQLAEGKDVAGVGVGCPGTVDGGTVLYSNNLDWHDFAMEEYLAQKTGLPVAVGNDANVAALGEALAGCAKGAQSTVVVTLGTGVGGGIVLNHKIYEGRGSAGEIGHICIDIHGKACPCGQKGCWEQYASATALKRMTAEALAAYPDSILARVITENDGHVSGQSAFIAAREGDPVGQMVCDRYVDYLACGVVNVVNIFQPDTLAIGGGVSNEADEQLLLPVQQRVARESIPCGKDRRTRIVKAQLGNRAGLIGAALLGKNKRI